MVKQSIFIFSFFLTVGHSLSIQAIANEQELYASTLAPQLLPAGEYKDFLDSIFVERKTKLRDILLDSGHSLLKDDFRIVAVHPEFPEWIIKGVPYAYENDSSFFAKIVNVGRVRIARKIQNFIEKYVLDHIVVPAKYLYHLPGRGYEVIDANYFVIAQRLDLVDDELAKKWWAQLGEEQEEELIKVIKKIGFYDVSFDNIRFTTEGKLAFIDTEPHRESTFIENLLLARRLKKYIVTRIGLGRLQQIIADCKAGK